jgi:diadenosine tetraphosphate (Ap4A) HIT family hydrolase
MPRVLRFEPPANARAGCALCTSTGGVPIWQDADWRVIRAEEPDFPAWYRVVLRRHLAEFSELDVADRARCMALVVAVEQVLIRCLRPTKVNLAAFGNQVPHLHWHVTARFDWDSHFPQPSWGARQRVVEPAASTRLTMPLHLLDDEVVLALQQA